MATLSPEDNQITVICQGCENECEVSIAVRNGKPVCLGGNNCPTGESFALAQAKKESEPMDIEIITGDITRLKVDAIVNAANCSLLGGGGVDGAIHDAAGEELFQECLALVNGLPGKRGKTGEAYLTNAGKLPCRFVIHTPGPVYNDGKHGEPELLSACYRNSLLSAEEKFCSSIAFPCISTGVYGYPRREAAAIAIKTIQTFSALSLKQCIFCCFSKSDAEIYRSILAEK